MHSVRLPPEGRSSPRPWGCFSIWPPVKTDVTVFPTPVGVFLGRVAFWKLLISLPHARGGVSMPSKGGLSPSGSSPRPWGCFLVGRGIGGHGLVFPTPVGVFPCCRRSPAGWRRLPHARGGVSAAVHRERLRAGSSPRPWGCFWMSRVQYLFQTVFPTPVGVFPGRTSSRVRRRSLPHARGGVSFQDIPQRRRALSSPRPWGCFRPAEFGAFHLIVFPTPVGVFPRHRRCDPRHPGLPHARGGVSTSPS